MRAQSNSLLLATVLPSAIWIIIIVLFLVIILVIKRSLAVKTACEKIPNKTIEECRARAFTGYTPGFILDTGHGVSGIVNEYNPTKEET